MLGIPLFIALFGTEQAYRMGVLDMTQSLVAIPVMAILTANSSENLAPLAIVKKVFQSPLLLMSLLGLLLNVSGCADLLNRIGIGGVITETTGFLAQPVSAVILFSVGYNFSMERGNRKQIFKLSAIHFGLFALFGVMMQAAMLLVPFVDTQTRWAILIFSTLPSSFLSSGMGKTEEECRMASGVCSILTVVSLAIFCVVAVIVA